MFCSPRHAEEQSALCRRVFSYIRRADGSQGVFYVHLDPRLPRARGHARARAASLHFLCHKSNTLQFPCTKHPLWSLHNDLFSLSLALLPSSPPPHPPPLLNADNPSSNKYTHLRVLFLPRPLIPSILHKEWRIIPRRRETWRVRGRACGKPSRQEELVGDLVRRRRRQRRPTGAIPP